MAKYNSLNRVLTALSHKEPDKVPLFLLLTMHGAKELNLSIKDYFGKAENVVEGQMLLREKFDNDCIYPFFYAPIEIEAMGGDVIYRNETPPNSGSPFFVDVNDIKSFETPNVLDSEVLGKVLKATQLLKSEVKDSVPIIGVVMSPFSLPVMQLGFDRYFDIMLNNRDLFNLLMKKNIEFCIDWANAQIKSGATAICYFDPVSSSSMITKTQYLELGYKVALKTISAINGPTATHFASGNALPIIEHVKETKTAVVGVSSNEDIGLLKAKTTGSISLLGNLNGVEMVEWSEEEAERQVKNIIKKAGKNGGLIISDNHGEIPYQVPDNVLFAIRDAVNKWGSYPLNI